MMPVSGTEWDGWISGLPGAHILQTWEWALFKAAYGWQPLPQVWRDENGKVRAAALVLRRSVPGGFSILYVPRGPLVDWADEEWSRRVIVELQNLARRLHAIFVKIDPELVLGYGISGTGEDRSNPAGEHMLAWMKAGGWRYSQEQIQFRNTARLDLAGSETDWLARMKQKARYNLRLAQKKGVQVRAGTLADLPMLYRMYAETSVRDGFVIRDERYYLGLWQRFMERGLAEPLVAEVAAPATAGAEADAVIGAGGEAVAGIIPFYFAGRAWYLYGMSRQAHREKMPNYLLQWEAMRRAKARGCSEYDLWGAPDVFDESDSMWGVFRFKEGLGAQVVRTAGAWDFPARPLAYILYTRVLPRVLAVMRRRGQARTRQEITL
ncbi:MAG: peptidoglycan bridge formation glycyltransferase FemA/FemB family protein [Chloroflexi bacterium]|nr:MAG: peptidoglycan bridge formation glycyltransferase FemA/FemB family protein [Chloroflexota bacterium]